MGLSASDAVAPTASADGALSVLGVSFRNLTPCNVVNGEYILMTDTVGSSAGTLTAASVPTGSSAPDASVAVPATTPGGRAFSATTRVLDTLDVPSKLAVLDSGAKYATMELPVNGFTFKQLFGDFRCEDIDLYVLNDVSVYVEENTDSGTTDRSIVFSGKINMDQGPLAVLKDFLKSDSAVLLTATIDIGDQDITQKIRPQYVTLSSAASFHIPIDDGVVLKSAQLQVTVEPQTDLKLLQSGWRIRVSVAGSIEFSKLGGVPFTLDCTVSYDAGTLSVSASAGNIANLFGISGLDVDSMQLQFELGSQKSIELSSYFSSGFRTFALSGTVSSAAAGIACSVSNFTLNDLDDLFAGLASDALRLPEYDVTFDNVTLGVATADCTIAGIALRRGLTLGCTVTIHGHTCDATALVSTDGVSLTGALSNVEVGPVQIASASLGLMLYSAASGKAPEFDVKGSATIEGITVDCDLRYEKTGGTWNAMLYAGLTASSFGLSTVFPPAKNTFVDSLRFSKLAFVYSAANVATQNPDYPFTVKQGLQLMGVLQEIPALSKLTGSPQIGLVFSAHFGATTDISIAIPDTRLKLGSSVTCDPLKIVIVIDPEPEFQLMFGMDVKLPKQSDPLHFDLALMANLVDAKASATMQNWWVNPFGVQGLKIGPAVALQIGIIYEQFVATGLPSEFGMAGGIAMGEVDVQMAVNIAEDPMKEVLLGSLSKLTAGDLVSFAGLITGLRLPADKIPDFFEVDDLRIYCTPSGGTIDTITFQPGFSFSGKLVLFGKSASVYTLFSASGVVAKGHIDNLELGPLKIGGMQGKDAELDLELTTDKQSLLVDGAINFLGLGLALHAEVSKENVNFTFEETFLGLLKYTIHGASSGSIKQPASLDFLLSAEFDNSLTDYLKNTVAKKIHDAIDAANTAIEDAEKKVDETEKAYMALFTPAKQKLDDAQAAADKYLDECVQKLKEERAKFTQKLNDAQSAVESAKQTYDNAMQSAQSAVDSAEQAYNDAFGSAQAALNSAQSTVDSLQDQLNDAANELDHLPWYKAYEAPYLAAKIAGLETAYGIAKGALYTAQGVLSGIQQSTQYTAWMAAKGTLEAVRYGADYTALQAAQQTLAGVQTTGRAALTATEDAVNTIGRSAVYIALQTAKQSLDGIEHGTAAIAFETAKAALEGVQQGTQALLNLAQYIATHAGDLIDVKRVKLSAHLKGIEQGDLFSADVDVAVLGHDFDWTLDFDVRNAAGFVENLFKKALDEAKEIVPPLITGVDEERRCDSTVR